jgi:hypothetical protein
MPVRFTVKPEAGYFEVEYTGIIDDEVMLQAWSDFFDKGDWLPGLNELTDLSKADFSKLTNSVLEELAGFLKNKYQEHGLELVKVAVYAPNPLAFGISRVYGAHTSDSPEDLHWFNSREDALAWVTAPIMQKSG